MKALILLTCAATALARADGVFSLTTAALDHAGGTQQSADYAQTSTLGIIHGSGSGAAPSVNRAGFAGQLYEAHSLQLGPPAAAIMERGTLQLTATGSMDDGSSLVLTGSDIVWTVTSGPIASISPAGTATAGSVYADTTARVLGSWASFSELLLLQVRNTGIDDYGLYAGDGLDDLWQVSWFGENNADGIATADPDHDGQDNTFEFLSGYSPVDAAEFLQFRFFSLSADKAGLELSRVQPGTLYDIETSEDLSLWKLSDTLTPEVLASPFQFSMAGETDRTFFRIKLRN